MWADDIDQQASSLPEGFAFWPCSPDVQDCPVPSLWLTHGSGPHYYSPPTFLVSLLMPLPRTWASFPFPLCPIAEGWSDPLPPSSLAPRDLGELWDSVIVRGWEEFENHLIFYLKPPKTQVCILLIDGFILSFNKYYWASTLLQGSGTKITFLPTEYLRFGGEDEQFHKNLWGGNSPK